MSGFAFSCKDLLFKVFLRSNHLYSILSSLKQSGNSSLEGLSCKGSLLGGSVMDIEVLLFKWPFLLFYENTVVLHPRTSFLLKVMSTFNINKDTVLPLLCHTLKHPGLNCTSLSGHDQSHQSLPQRVQLLLGQTAFLFCPQSYPQDPLLVGEQHPKGQSTCCTNTCSLYQIGRRFLGILT